MTTPTAGMRLGAYEVLSLIGAGGMGAVWKGRDTRLDRTVAIKFTQAQFAARFETEARTIAALNHPNIAQIYDVGDDYIVMEYVDGAPVRAPDTIRKLLDIATQIADGLAAAHHAGIIHRDLKPDNVLITKDGRVKILDFGLARQTQAAAADAATQAMTRTDPGTILGTIAYMSPEQARAQPLDARSDQFSFGLILYELAAGKRAFTRESAAETMTAIIREEPEALPGTVPAPLRWIIERCLRKDAADRYDTTRGLYLELRNLPERLTESTSTVPSAALPPARRRPLPWLFAGAAIPILFLIAHALRAPWQPDITQYRIVPFANEEYPEEFPAWSPDGRSIAYVAQREDNFQLMLRDMDGSPPVTLATRALPILSLSWSSDSSRIYFTPYGSVYSVGRAGGEPVRLAGFQRTYSSAMSPDGRSLAAMETDGPEARGRRRLVIASPPDSKPQAVSGFDPPCCFNPDFLTWSLDSKLLIAAIPTTHGQEVWVVNAAGGSRRLAESRVGSDFQARWLPDGRHAIFSADDQPGLRVLDTGTGTISNLFPASQAGQPTLTTDGTRIAFTQGSGRFSMLEIPLDGSAPRPLLRSRLTLQYPAWAHNADQFLYVRDDEILLHDRQSGTDRTVITRRAFPKLEGAMELIEPIFSPDDKRIAFSLRTAAGESVWIVPITGGVPAALGETEGDHLSPSWSPDGKWIAYSYHRADGTQFLRKIRVGGGEKPIELGEYRCRPEWSPTGEWILCTVNPPTQAPRLISPDGQVIKELQVSLQRPGAWSRDGASIYMTSGYRPRRVGLAKFDWKTGAVTHIVDYPGTLRFNSRAGAGRSLSMSPDGKSLAGTIEASEGDIWILEGFQGPPSFWQKLLPRF